MNQLVSQSVSPFLGNQCISVASTQQVTEPALLAVATAATAAGCTNDNGAVSITSVTGGTAPYSYNFNGSPVTSLPANNTFTGLVSGNYDLIVTDANNCTYTVLNIVVTQPSSLTASIAAQTNVSCFGGSNGSATAAGSGGTSPYSYSWNTTPAQLSATATGLSQGNYTATVRLYRDVTTELKFEVVAE